MPKHPVITLTTDFGDRGPFVGIMKGVIININHSAIIVDLCNHIEPHNIFEASLFLSMSYEYFPKGSIHVAVVDPGVGSERRPILLSCGGHYFIGPDNGIFSHIYDKYKGNVNVIHITAKHYLLQSIGDTFHGRDVFAPVAGWLSKGIDTQTFGNKIDDYLSFKINKPKKIKETIIKGEVSYIDTFGNAITNLTKRHID
ncbi:MAG: hypothetical protein D6828_02215, partial [Nitrospirae bacterium]